MVNFGIWTIKKCVTIIIYKQKMKKAEPYGAAFARQVY